MADMAQKLFEKYHPDFKGDLTGNIGRADAAASYRRSGKPLIFGYDLSDLNPDVNPIRYIPTRDGNPILSKLNMTFGELSDSQRASARELIISTQSNRMFTRWETLENGGSSSYQVLNLNDDEIEILKSALPDQHTMIQMRGSGWKLDDLPDEVLIKIVDSDMWILPDIEYIPHIYVGSADSIDEFKISTQALMSGADSPIDDQIALTHSIEMVENGDLVPLHNMSDEQLSEYGIRKKDNIAEFYNDAIIQYVTDKAHNQIYDSAMAEYRQKLQRFQELEKYMAEQGISYKSELDRDYPGRKGFNLHRIVMDTNPNKEILEAFDNNLNKIDGRARLAPEQMPMTTYYRRSGALLDEWENWRHELIGGHLTPLTTLFAEIEREHRVTKTYLSALESNRANTEVRLRQLAFSYPDQPQRIARAVRENLEYLQSANDMAFSQEVSIPMQSMASMRMKYKIESIERLLASDAVEGNIELLTKGRQLLDALYLDYFENLETALRQSYHGSDVLFESYFRRSDQWKPTPSAGSPENTYTLVESNFHLRDEHALNEAMSHWNSGMDIDEFIEYLQNDWSNAWQRQLEKGLTDNMHLNEDLKDYTRMQREITEMADAAKQARELINAATRNTDLTIESVFVKAINDTELYKFDPLSRKYIDYLFFSDPSIENIGRIISKIKPENRGFLQRDIFYELLNRSRQWEGKYLRTANRKEVPFWKHSQDYELGHFLDDIVKSVEFGDTSQPWLNGAKSITDIDTANHVVRFDNRLMTLFNSTYLPSNLINWMIDQYTTEIIPRTMGDLTITDKVIGQLKQEANFKMRDANVVTEDYSFYRGMVVSQYIKRSVPEFRGLRSDKAVQRRFEEYRSWLLKLINSTDATSSKNVVVPELLKRDANIYELEDPTPILKILRDLYIQKYKEGDIQGILDSIQEPGTLYYDTIPYARQGEDTTDDLPSTYNRVWRTGAPGGGLFTTDTLDAAEGFRHDNVARSRDLVLLIMEGEDIGSGIPDPAVEHIIKPTELIAVAPFEWGDQWQASGITPIGPALALQIELTKLGGNAWLESIWDSEMSSHLTDLAQIYDQWEGYKGSPIPDNLNPRYSDEPGAPSRLTPEEVLQEQKLRSELKTKREKRRRDAEDIVEQVEGIGLKSSPALAPHDPQAIWNRTYGIEIECFLDLKDPNAGEVRGVTQEALRRTSEVLNRQDFTSEGSYTSAYEGTSARTIAYFTTCTWNTNKMLEILPLR